MNVDVVFLPGELEQRHLADRAVVVFDVLRATTTMVTALAAGAAQIRVFDSLESAASAAQGEDPRNRLLCGERACLRPPGFDLGNSPGEFTPQRCAGRTAFMSTTNGTRAIVAAQAAPELYVAALVNVRAAAEALARSGRSITLLCAGTEGQFSLEDALGAGAVIESLKTSRADVLLESDRAQAAWRLFLSSRLELPAILRNTGGGRNITRAGLEPDLDFAAQLDVFALAGAVRGRDPLVVSRIG